MMKKWIGLFFILLISMPDAGAQAVRIYSVKGKVIDADTKEPLAFVNILVNEGPNGGTTDIDGVFSFSSKVPVEFLKLSYVGYEPVKFPVTGSTGGSLVIRLRAQRIDLPEIEILPGINPANRIIKLVLDNMDQNDPDKIPSFSYTAYDRTILTARLDTVNIPDTAAVDSSLIKAKEFFARQDIGIIESVVERKFIAPDLNYENVVANRVSGFKDPVFVFLLSRLQSTSFYDPMFHIVNKHYVNPVSRGSTSKYYFQIEDTTFTTRNDTVFIISYRPLLNTNFDGLKGLLYINSYKWAIQSVIAEPARMESISIKIQQKYELIDSTQWFPVQLNTDVIFNNAMIQAGETKTMIVGVGKSYIKDIVLNPEKIRRQMDILGVDVEPDAHDKNDEYWTAYRIDSLSERDQRTYEFMDSLGREAKLDQFARGFETVVSGKIPYKSIEFDLDKVFKYNSYQGIYLGLGLHTSERFSRKLKIGGYWGYGFRDKKAKYGADAGWILNRRKDIRVYGSYSLDLTETGGVSLMFDKKSFLRGDDWHYLLVTRMNETEQALAGFSFRMLRDLQVGFELRSLSKNASYDYQYAVSGEDVTILLDQFDFTEAVVGLRFAFREEFLVTKRSKVSLGTKYPIMWMQYTRGLSGFLGGEYEYNRIDLKIKKSFYLKYLGKSSFVLKGGLIDGKLPFCNLYNGNGSYRMVTIFAPESFATMRMNEFLSDRYIALYWQHDFGKLLFRHEKFAPEFLISTNIGFGWLDNPEAHYNVDFKSMEKGYFESGILVNNMLNLGLYSVGIGAFYRYGPYSLKGIDNAAFKFSIIFPFGE